MDDLISRQAAIDELEERKFANGRTGEPNVAVISELNKAIGYIMRLPSAQPERCEDCVNFNKTRLLIPQSEIIRCKDCKYSDTDNTLGVMFCWRVSYHEASEDGFCSWAKRREA